MDLKTQPKAVNISSHHSSSARELAADFCDHSPGTSRMEHNRLRNVDPVWLLEAVPDAIVLPNGQKEKMFGFRPHELMGRAVENLVSERILAEISGIFVTLEPKTVDDQIREAQKRICESLGLDSSTLFEMSRDDSGVVVTHRGAAEGVADTPPPLSAQDFPWCARVLLSGRRLSLTRIEDLPDEAARDKETLRRYGPNSNVNFLVLSNGKILTFGSMSTERDWLPTRMERLNLVAEVFCNALAGARSQQDLRQAYGEIEKLKQQLEKESVCLREEVTLEHHHNEVIGNSESIRRILRLAEQVAGTDSNVLVLGETGTGKELVARTIHEHSRRKGRVMVKVNCAALPGSLVESELFGREKAHSPVH